MTNHPAPPPLREPRLARVGSGARIAAAVAIALLSFLPLAAWIPGGYEEAQFDLQRDEWISGTAIALGLGVVLAMLSRGRRALWRTIDGAALDARVTGRWWLMAGVVTAVAFLGYLAVTQGIFAGLPQQIDEITQTIQARIFAGGRLWAQIPEPMEFFTTQHMLYVEGKAFSQFPPGGPAAIALFMKMGAEWLVGPAFAAAAVLAFAAWLRQSSERPATALLALAIFALAPFTLFMSGSRMNHVMTTTFTLVASAALLATVRSAGPRPLAALLCGLGYGLAATFRPVDAAAFALPGAAWLATLALRDRRRFVDLVVSGVGVALPLAAFFWFNEQTTGSPTLFGYQLLWGKGHDIGFHVAPWGLAHTPVLGLELLHLYFFRFQRVFLETPIPSLLPALVVLACARRVSAEDRYLLAGSLLVVGAYWAYWHNGYFLGPRFLYPLVPVAAVWTARFPAFLRDRLAPRTADDSAPGSRRSMLYRTAVFTCLVAVLLSAVYSTPMRALQYRATFAGGHWSAPAEAAKAGVRDAIVLVREGWESQLVVRLWRLGVGHARSERYYPAIDVCRLDQAITALERAGADAATAERELDALLADSVKVRKETLPSGASIRIQPDHPYPPDCRARLTENIAGVLPLGPTLAAPPDGNVWARDLHARDTLLLARFPGRPIYLLRPESADRSSRPLFIRVDLDSARRDWQLTTH